MMRLQRTSMGVVLMALVVALISSSFIMDMGIDDEAGIEVVRNEYPERIRTHSPNAYSFFYEVRPGKAYEEILLRFSTLRVMEPFCLDSGFWKKSNVTLDEMATSIPIMDAYLSAAGMHPLGFVREAIELPNDPSSNALFYDFENLLAAGMPVERASSIHTYFLFWIDGDGNLAYSQGFRTFSFTREEA